MLKSYICHIHSYSQIPFPAFERDPKIFPSISFITTTDVSYIGSVPSNAPREAHTINIQQLFNFMRQGAFVTGSLASKTNTKVAPQSSVVVETRCKLRQRCQ